MKRLVARLHDSVGFDGLAIGLVFVTAAALACLAPAQSDTWWHLRAGKDIWTTGHVSLTDTYSYTALGRSWPDHETSWQVLAYVLHAIGGMPLLALGNAVVAVGAVVLSWRLVARRKGLTIVLLFLAIPGITAAWSLRPQVASMFCFALLVSWVVRERYYRLPVLFLVWANLHGAVATGGLAMVVVTALAILAWVRNHSAANEKRLTRLMVVTPLCAVATLVTPMGLSLWSYVGSSIGRSKSDHISEWQSAFHLGPVEVAFWLWLVALLVLLVRNHRRVTGWAGWVPVVLALAMTPLSIGLKRNIPFFLLVALPAVASVLPESAPRPADAIRAAKPVLTAYAVLAVVLVGLAWANPPARLGWTPISPAAVAAVRACKGPIYNTYDEGGPLIWFVPQVPVFIDSRQDPYPDSLVAADARVEQTGDFDAVVSEYGIRCAVVPPGSQISAGLRSEGWRTSYADADWLVFTPPAAS